jgi:hypothetical protein
MRISSGHQPLDARARLGSRGLARLADLVAAAWKKTTEHRVGRLGGRNERKRRRAGTGAPVRDEHKQWRHIHR